MFLGQLECVMFQCRSDDDFYFPAESVIGNWCLLNIERDLMVVSCSSPNCPPCLVVSVFSVECCVNVEDGNNFGL